MVNLNTELITNQFQERKIQQNFAGENSAPVNIPIGKNESLDELCNRLQIKREQLEFLMSKYEDFIENEALQTERILKLESQALQSEGILESEDVVPNKFDLENIETNISFINNNNNLMDVLKKNSMDYNSRRAIAATFMNAKVEDKIKILQIELAKNAFFSGDSDRSIDDWKKLDADTRDFYIKQAEKTVSETVCKQNDSGEKEFCNFSAEKMLVNIFVANDQIISGFSYKEIADITLRTVANAQDSDRKSYLTHIISARYEIAVGEDPGIFSECESEYGNFLKDEFGKQIEKLEELQSYLSAIGINTKEIVDPATIRCAGDFVDNIDVLLEYLNNGDIKTKLPSEIKDKEGYVTIESIKVYFDSKKGKVDENTKVAEQVANIGYDPNKRGKIDHDNIYHDIQEQLVNKTTIEQVNIIYQAVLELATDSSGKVDNDKVISELEKLVNYLPMFDKNELASLVSGKIADFRREKGISQGHVGSGSQIEAYTIVAISNGKTTTETAAECTLTAVETNNHECSEKYVRAINNRTEDRQEVRKMTNKMVAESEKATDESKAYYAQYTVETAATEEERNNQVADLQQYNLDSFNKGVENAYVTIAQNNTDSAPTSQGSISKSSSSTTSEVETTPAQYTAYQTNPISNDRVEIVQTPKTEAAKSVYEQIVSGKASVGKIAEVFNKLSSDEKVNVLKSLTSSEIVKMPVSICGLCPEFIPQFVAAKKGIEVIKTVPDAAAATILHMKKSNDREVQKDLQVFMIEHPDQFMKISVADAREKLGVREDDNRLINHIRFRA